MVEQNGIKKVMKKLQIKKKSASPEKEILIMQLK